MSGRYFDWCHCRHPKSTLTPEFGEGVALGGGGSTLDIGIAAKREQIEQNFVLRRIWKSWLGFRLVRILTRYHSLNPQNWGS